MSRRPNPEHIASWYDPEKLKAKFKWEKGIEYVEPVMRLLNVAHSTAEHKVCRSGIRHEESIIIAEYLNMSLEEYRQIFLKDVKFRED